MDMNIRGGGGFQDPGPQDGPKEGIKKVGDPLANMIGSLRQTPRYSASQPVVTGEVSKLAPTKELIRTVVQSVSSDAHKATKSTIHGIVNQCSRMAQIELAESIAEEVKTLPSDQQHLFWKNIAAFTIKTQKEDTH